MSNDATLQARLNRLEREYRFARAICGGMLLFLLLAGMSPQRRANSVIVAHQISFVTADGRQLGKLVVDDRRNDLVLSGEDGKSRLTISGLGGINIPPFTALTLHDADGFERVTVSSTAESAGISVMTHEDQPITVDTFPPSLVRLSLSVKDDKGTLSFIGRDNKVLQRLPN